MQLLISLKDLELDKYLKYTNSFLLGLKNLSVNSLEVELDDIKNILDKYKNIDLFINLNKNMFQDDIDYLENTLKELSKLKIKGIFFYDLSILEINRELDLNLNLIISQDHLITNYNICNYYYNNKVKTSNLSLDITTDEIIDISKNSKSDLIITLFGHILVTSSKRKLITNYYNYLNEENNHDIHIINEKNKDTLYYIIDKNYGTIILTKKVLNAYLEYLKLKDIVKYGILDCNLIDDDLFIEVLKLYSLNINKKLTDREFIDLMNKLDDDKYDGFYNLETIYKVK